MKVDILIAVAERGGPENIIRMMIDKLTPLGMQFRVVQMAWEGYRWLDEDVAFYPLTEGKGGHTIVEFCQVYSALLDETGEVPELVLAAAWPYMNVLAKEVFATKGLRIPVISWLHTDVEAYARKGFGGWPELLTADAHFAISDDIQKAIRKQDPRACIYRLHNPVEITQTEGNDSHNPKTGLHRTLLFVGRLSQEKNIPFLLQTLTKLPSWHLLLVGDGEERKHLQSLCEQAGLSQRVRFLGWQEQPWEYAEDADALILSSFYEGFPLTVIEALSHGLPVLSTKVNGIPELIRPGVNGYLYDTGDHEELLRLLTQIEAQGFVVEHPEQCQTFAREYDSDLALWDMAVKMKAVCRGVKLRPNTSHHPWYAFRQKLSVIFQVEEWDNDALIKTIHALFHGKNDALNMQAVLVTSQDNPDNSLSQELTESYPEQVLWIFVPCPSTQTIQEALTAQQLHVEYTFFPKAGRNIETRELLEALEQQILPPA